MSSTANPDPSVIHPASAQSPSDAADAQSANLLLQWLEHRDVACPLCGYNLRGLITARCPECGTGLALSVSTVDLPLRPWIALLVALLLPAGLGSLIIVMFFYGLLRNGFQSATWGNVPPGVVWIMSHLVLSVPLSILALAGRRRFLRWPIRVQRACAAFAWAAIGITIAVVIFEISSL